MIKTIKEKWLIFLELLSSLGRAMVAAAAFKVLTDIHWVGHFPNFIAPFSFIVMSAWVAYPMFKDILTYNQ